MTLKLFDLFAGVGGFRLAAEKFFKNAEIDYKFTGYSEIDKYCNITYKSNFNVKDEFYINDIKKITEKREKELPPFDVLLAGFPCQSFSSMGNQRSLSDERGSLFFDIVKVLRDIQPKYFILENVRKILTIDKKKTINIIMDSISEIGYEMTWFLMNSADYGIPQIRRRVFFIGSRKNLKQKHPLEPPTKKKLLKTTLDILEKKVSEKYYLSEKILKTILCDGTSGYKSKATINNKIAKCLTKTMHKMHRANQDNYFSNQYINNDKKEKWIRKITPLEAFRLQGFPDSFVKKAINAGVSNTQLYMQAGNSVTIDVVYALLKTLHRYGWFSKEC